MNGTYEVLTKCCYFGADPLFKMAASGELSLTLDPMGNALQKSSSREPLNGFKSNLA